MTRRLALAMFAMMLSVAAVGCVSTSELSSPTAVTRAHVEASQRGDREEAARWLTEGAVRAGRMWPPSSEVPKGAVTEQERSATWTLKTGRRVVVKRGEGGWRIDAGVLGLDRADTPEQAIRVLARVVLSRDFAGLLQLLPLKERGFWTPERLAQHLSTSTRRSRWESLAKRLQSPPANGWPMTWRVPGERVELRVGSASAGGAGVTTLIVLAREQGAWKVLDVLPHHHYTPAR